MKFPALKKIVLRLYNFYVKEHFGKIALALFLSFGVAGGTAAIAWLLDPAVKKIFVDQNKTMMLLIPAAIVFAFSVKGLSLYFSRIALIKVSQEIIRKLGVQMTSRILESDIHTLESKHSGKYISHFLYDVGLVAKMVGTGVLNLMKDSLTLIVLIGVMFYQNWKLACFALIMMPLAAFVAKSMGKRLGKVTAESAEISGDLSTFLIEIIKGSRMIKIYQQEKFEFNRSGKILKLFMEKQIKIASVMIRATPIMELLTGIMIAGFIYYTGLMVSTGEIGINKSGNHYPC
jgi:subfamily B ATP-binding cassette protein MsbA